MENAAFGQIQVLLVEPSHTQQLIISKYLNNCGIIDIHCVKTGASALDHINRCPPDLIISAMYLPDMTGVTLVHTIRNEESSYDMAFLLISSETNIRYLDPIRQAGAIGILPKPFSYQKLEVALTATLDFLNPEHIDLEHFDIEDICVLLADDSSTSLKFITRLLNDAGIENISTATNGKQAITLINQKYFDLIITDYNMPEMDGLGLTQHIRSHTDYKTTPILMVTSEQNSNRLAAVEHAGVSAILDKPFEPASIRTLIIKLLS